MGWLEGEGEVKVKGRAGCGGVGSALRSCLLAGTGALY